MRTNPSLVFPTNCILGGEVPLPPGTSCLVKGSYIRQAGLAPRRRSENFWRASRVLCEAGPCSILCPSLISGAEALSIQISHGGTGRGSLSSSCSAIPSHSSGLGTYIKTAA